jgi:hypothetical protein
MLSSYLPIHAKTLSEVCSILGQNKVVLAKIASKRLKFTTQRIDGIFLIFNQLFTQKTEFVVSQI